MFKIVQTIERGNIFLTSVPSAWEQDGFLFWPPSRKPKCMAKLLRDPDSHPEPGWTSQTCLKKKEFDSFEEAEAEINMMESNSDTDASLIQVPAPKKKKTTSRSDEIYPDDKSFEIMCETKDSDQYIALGDIANQANINKPEIQNNGHKSISEVPVINNQPELADINKQNIASDFSLFMKTTSENIKEITEKLDKIFKELAKQHDFHEIYIDIITKLNEKLSSTHLTEVSSDFGFETPTLVDLRFPIKSEVDLDEMELHLNDPKNMNDLITKMKDVCGESGLRNAVTSAYQLVDRFFTRQFLLHVTWSGGSRCEQKKIGLKNFKNILSAFTSVVKLAAGAFDEQKCKDFFCIVLRNSKKRTAKNPNIIPRASAQKKVTNKMRTETTTESEPTTVKEPKKEIDVSEI